jgi:DNA polymerase/3'-5' exonuclease PolX
VIGPCPRASIPGAVFAYCCWLPQTLDHVVPPFQLEVCGGFRRGKADGKDIDLIITQRGVRPAAQLDACQLMSSSLRRAATCESGMRTCQY